MVSLFQLIMSNSCLIKAFTTVLSGTSEYEFALCFKKWLAGLCSMARVVHFIFDTNIATTSFRFYADDMVTYCEPGCELNQWDLKLVLDVDQTKVVMFSKSNQGAFYASLQVGSLKTELVPQQKCSWIALDDFLIYISKVCIWRKK